MDDDGFHRYVQERQRALLRTAWLLTGDWGRAEDLVQVALERLWPRWERVTRRGSPDAYVRRVMVNAAVDWRRRRWTGEVPHDVLPEPAAAVAVDHDLAHVVVAAVRALPPRQRATVVLRWFDDLSEADTAAALGCSVGTVKSQSAKAAAALRRHPGLADLHLEGAAR
ncbi:SigE family RNA polymerase sigma factor [Aquipuribacter nitratireducens]|uniref:SigE family RNA polymerase sigma factor n=1 Tax=Aquipuribacter nitratireducens TaxID=650104 RepID=A0ABW0GQK0_9MICO